MVSLVTQTNFNQFRRITIPMKLTQLHWHAAIKSRKNEVVAVVIRAISEIVAKLTIL